ncbi:methyltransferase domain-containing protein [Rhodobacterales bacterium HKCCA1065]|nr:methyltransferase domain-containing protein [Rhodobacterales bacterium HKCCA1065]
MKTDAQALTRAMAANGWHMDTDALFALTDLDREGLHEELAKDGRDLEGFKSRLRYLGMTDHDKVLDFGCGFGQWSLALADLNATVFGVDKAARRLAIARLLADQTQTSGAVTFGESLEELGLGADQPAGQLDAIFCYSVFMFVPGEMFMAEFARMLRPGGQLYIMVDLPGWHLQRLARTPMALPAIAYMTLNTLIGRDRNIVYTRRSLEKRITNHGFDLVETGTDYTSSFKPQAARGEQIEALRLPQTFMGLPMLHEVCAVRK